MQLDRLLADAPKFGDNHRTGEAVSWAIADDVLAWLYEAVAPGARTVETGAGVSTIVFALRGATHTCVAPAEDEVARIRAYCSDAQISLERVTFHIARSEDVLPSLDLVDLDVALIDGGHGFPVPFLDWFHLAGRLRRGGHVIVDDTQLWTGRILRDFLCEEADWLLETEIGKTAIFRKLVGHSHRKEWRYQPFVVRRSEAPTTEVLVSAFLFRAKVVVVAGDPPATVEVPGRIPWSADEPPPNCLAGSPTSATGTLEALRASGAQFLLVHGERGVWPESEVDLRARLTERSRILVDDDRYRLYQLIGPLTAE